MTVSRAIGIASGVGAFLAGVSSSVGLFNPKLGGILAGIGGAITMFCERAHGSPEYRRRKARERAITEAQTAPLPKARNDL